MLEITFHPEYDKDEYILAAKEYQSIWDNEGDKITDAIEKASGLRFIENSINALVFEGRSYSHPLQLRASNPKENKQATIVHELCHRICFGNKVATLDTNESKLLRAHKVIFLVLFDALTELYGETYAQENVEHESKFSEEYQQAWDWALSLSKEERKIKFENLKSS